jgi:hypothetical protein
VVGGGAGGVPVVTVVVVGVGDDVGACGIGVVTLVVGGVPVVSGGGL